MEGETSCLSMFSAKLISWKTVDFSKKKKQQKKTIVLQSLTPSDK